MFTRTFVPLALAASLLAPGLARAGMTLEEIQTERATIRQDVKSALTRLYATQPRAKLVVSRAAGYAVINNFGMKILVAGGGSGKGLAIDKAGHEVFMKMVEVQAGLGMGVQKFTQVWVFSTADGLKKFISGEFEFSGSASAGAQLDKQGIAYAGALPVSPGVWLYQLQGDGLALSLTAKGTKYYRYDELN